MTVDQEGHALIYGDFYDVTPSIAFAKAGGGNLTLTRAADTDDFLFKLSP